MNNVEKKMKYEDIQDLISLTLIKVRRIEKEHECGENVEIVNCLKGANMWIDQLLLTME